MSLRGGTPAQQSSHEDSSCDGVERSREGQSQKAPSEKVQQNGPRLTAIHGIISSGKVGRKTVGGSFPSCYIRYRAEAWGPRSSLPKCCRTRLVTRLQTDDG